MKPIFSTKQVISGLYDFAEFGGVAGTIDLNVSIPKNSIATRFVIRTWADLTSLGASIISIDSINGAVVGTGVFAVAQPFANFNTVTPTLAGIDFNLTPTLLPPGLGLTDDTNIGVTISVADITGGKFQVIVEFLQTDNLL